MQNVVVDNVDKMVGRWAEFSSWQLFYKGCPKRTCKFKLESA
jgi:hypothetical protein